jgi:arsenite/tail-anchored protein-transporting ATPase
VRSRTILYTGKGGVGKTTLAAATARRCAAGGLRTLVVSADGSGDLAIALQAPLGEVPRELDERLWAAEVRTQAALQRAWRGVQERVGAVLVEHGIDRIAAEELAVPAGAEALATLLRLVRDHEREDFDVVVVDCPSTTETLRMLALPDLARWWLERVFPQRSRLAAAARPLGRAALEVSLPADALLGLGQRLVRDAIAAGDVLREHERVSVRVVATPQRMALAQARRALTGLGLHGVLADAVIVNRAQSVPEGLGDVPTLTAPDLGEEAIGAAALDRLGAAAFGEHDPAAMLRDRAPQELVLGPDGAELRLEVPFATRETVSLKKIGLELVVRIDGQQRTLTLPPALAGHRPSGASLEDGGLRVRFDA